MAGHSKWANIKHKKSRADEKRGKLFTRLVKEIISAVKQGGGEIDSNPRLRLVVQKAKAANLSSEVIESNIKKAMGLDSKEATLSMVYELYGHGGVGIIVEASTDNKQRTLADIYVAINKKGGTISSKGAVTFTFERRGIILLPAGSVEQDELLGYVLDGGAEDLRIVEGHYEIITPPERLYEVGEFLSSHNLPCEDFYTIWRPKHCVMCDQETAEKNRALIEWLEGLEDVEALFHNMKES